MKKVKVLLKSIADVKRFVTASAMQSCEIDVQSGRYLIDAKSIMGLFSLDLGNPVTVRIGGDDDECVAFCSDIEDLIIKD